METVIHFHITVIHFSCNYYSSYLEDKPQIHKKLNRSKGYVDKLYYLIQYDNKISYQIHK